MAERITIKEYDEEPVAYCKRCYSLNVRHDDDMNIDYCGDCGGTEILETDIWNWEEMYRERYGHRLVDDRRNPRKSMFFNVGIRELKRIVMRHEQLERIWRKMYEKMPKGLTREESVIVLFDKLGKDNRIDDLRYFLYRLSREYAEKNRINVKTLDQDGREENESGEQESPAGETAEADI